MQNMPAAPWTWALALALAIGLQSSAGCAAGFPDRPVKLIVPGATASDVDVISRLVADRLAKVWNQPVLIDNRSGGAGLIATQAAAAATSDGYTLYLAQASTFTIVPYVGPASPIDPMQAFVPIAFVAEIPFGFAVEAARGKKSLADLIKFAADNPEKLDVGTGFVGGLNNLAGEMFARRAGVRVHIVPYRTGALADLLGGRLDMSITGVAGLAGQVAAGKLRLLAVTSDRRLPHFPDVPTVREFVPGFVAVGWFALFAPSGTPATVVQRIHDDVKHVLEDPELGARLANLGAIPRYMSAEELAAFIRKEREVWGPMAQEFEAKGNEPAK